MALTRTQHWATRALHPFLFRNRKASFQYGVRDCCLFAADAVQAITGVDIAADFRSKYTDESSAFALIKSLTGGSTVADAAAYCAEKHGLVEWTHPLCAQRGDLAVVQDDDRLIAGVVHLTGKDVVSIGESGLLLVPFIRVDLVLGPVVQIKRAWKV